MRIAILDDYQNLALTTVDWAPLRARADITVFNDTLPMGNALIARLQPFDVLCLMRERTPLDAALIAALPNLKLVVTTGKRNDAIDMAAAQARNIVVCGTESPSSATPELAFALMLGLARGLIGENRSMRDGGWQIGLGRDLAGANLGIVGLGRLGEKVARIAAAFDMNVTAWSHNLGDERCAQLGVTRKNSLHDLLAGADFVTIHQRLSSRTTGLIGADELAVMKPTAFLINTSRGPIVDTTALLAALDRGQLAGAGIDVYDHEPLPPTHPLRQSDKLLLTPHLGYVTADTWQVFYGQTRDAVIAWLDGAPIRVIPA